MYTFTDNQAKTQFGEMMVKAKREPVSITRNGKPYVVLLSAGDYALFEELKMENLHRVLAQSENDIADGHVVDGCHFFDALERK